MSELPMIGDYGIEVGAPPILHSDSIYELNAELKKTIGFSEKNKQMGDHVITVVERSHVEREVHANKNVLCFYY